MTELLIFAALVILLVGQARQGVWGAMLEKLCSPIDSFIRPFSGGTTPPPPPPGGHN